MTTDSDESPRPVSIAAGVATRTAWLVVVLLLPAFFAFLKPRFHPWKLDSSRHIAGWLAANQHYIQTQGTTPSTAPQSA